MESVYPSNSAMRPGLPRAPRVCVRACVCACVNICVCERERDRQKVQMACIDDDAHTHIYAHTHAYTPIYTQSSHFCLQTHRHRLHPRRNRHIRQLCRLTSPSRFRVRFHPAHRRGARWRQRRTSGRRRRTWTHTHTHTHNRPTHTWVCYVKQSWWQWHR